MTENVTADEVRAHREEAEATRDEPVSEHAQRPNRSRGTILSVRLTSEEFDELARYASANDAPISGLVRGWIVDRLCRGESDSATQTVERITQELHHLRQQLAA